MPPRQPFRPDRRPHSPRGQAGRPAASSIAFGHGGSAVSACRRFSRPKKPTRRLSIDPERLSTGLSFHERPLQRRSQGDRPRCRLCSCPGIRFAGYPDHHSSHHSTEEVPEDLGTTWCLAASACVFTPAQAERCALCARSSTTPPFGPYGPPKGTGPLVFLRRAARARGSACKTRPGRFPRTPLVARAKPAAAAIRRKASSPTSSQ